MPTPFPVIAYTDTASPPTRTEQPGTPTMTTSVAVLPSSPLLTHESYAQAAPAARLRPKLSLDTAISSGMRQGSTSLSIASLSNVSLTDRNTFVNAWDPVTVPSTPLTQILPSLPPTDPIAQHAAVVHSPDSIRPASSDSSPQTPVASYALSTFPRSILTNSLHPQREQHARAKRIASAAPKLMFPPVKRVSFRPQPVEEIQTVRFTHTHQDLLLLARQQPTRSHGVKRESPPPEELEQEQQASTDEESTHDDDAEDADERMAYAKTPVAGRKRRKGEWRWTLGPLDSENDGLVDDGNSLLLSSERRGSDSSESSTSSSSEQGWSKTLMDKIRVDEWRKA